MAEKKISKLVAKLELNEFKLNSLLEITNGINNNASIQNILKIFEYILREQLGISKLILYALVESFRIPITVLSHHKVTLIRN